jgi:hypothetical protein
VRPPAASAPTTEGPKASPSVGGRPRYLALAEEPPCANERLLRDGLMLSLVEWRLPTSSRGHAWTWLRPPEPRLI